MQTEPIHASMVYARVPMHEGTKSSMKRQDEGAPSNAMTVEAILRRDRPVMGAGLVLIAGLSWAYTLWLAVGMALGHMPIVMAMPQPGAWSAVDLGLMFVMWLVMMAAMMTPSVAPTVL